MKTKRLYFAIMLLIFIVVFITFRSEVGIKLVWKGWYGNQKTWGGVNIRLTGDEYFVPKSSEQNVLHIADRVAGVLISVSLENKTADEQRVIVEQNCKISECTQSETKRFQVESVPVTLFKYLERFSDSRLVLQHVYVVEGADVWVAYSGDQTRFQMHEPTINGIVAEIARKTKRSSSNG